MFNKTSSRKLSMASAACMAVVALGGLALWPTGSSEVHALSGDDDNGIGRLIVGTWVEAGPGFSVTMNIRADGTLTWWGSFFFGDGTGEFLDGPVFGAWKQTGVREITTSELGYLNNGDGSFFASGRLQEVFNFDPEFESFTYVFVEELFAPAQDPTDPDEVPFDSFGGSGGPVNRLGFFPAIDDDDDDDDSDSVREAARVRGTNGQGTVRSLRR